MSSKPNMTPLTMAQSKLASDYFYFALKVLRRTNCYKLAADKDSYESQAIHTLFLSARLWRSDMGGSFPSYLKFRVMKSLLDLRREDPADGKRAQRNSLVFSPLSEFFHHAEIQMEDTTLCPVDQESVILDERKKTACLLNGRVRELYLLLHHEGLTIKEASLRMNLSTVSVYRINKVLDSELSLLAAKFL